MFLQSLYFWRTGHISRKYKIIRRVAFKSLQSLKNSLTSPVHTSHVDKFLVYFSLIFWEFRENMRSVFERNNRTYKRRMRINPTMEVSIGAKFFLYFFFFFLKNNIISSSTIIHTI